MTFTFAFNVVSKIKEDLKMKNLFAVINNILKLNLVWNIMNGSFFAEQENDEPDENENLFFLSDKLAIVISRD